MLHIYAHRETTICTMHLLKRLTTKWWRMTANLNWQNRTPNWRYIANNSSYISHFSIMNWFQSWSDPKCSCPSNLGSRILSCILQIYVLCIKPDAPHPPWMLQERWRHPTKAHRRSELIYVEWLYSLQPCARRFWIFHCLQPIKNSQKQFKIQTNQNKISFEQRKSV